jgi:hypothetical protein
MPASARWVREGILAKYDAENAGAKTKAGSTARRSKSAKEAKTSGRNK